MHKSEHVSCTNGSEGSLKNNRAKQNTKVKNGFPKDRFQRSNPKTSFKNKAIKNPFTQFILFYK